MIPAGVVTQQRQHENILIYDTFTDTDGINLSAHTPDINIGTAWQTTFAASTKVYNNKADARDNTGGAFTSLIDCGESNVIVEADFIGSSGTSACGLWIRQNNVNEGFFLGVSDAQLASPRFILYTYTGGYIARDIATMTNEGPMGGVAFYMKLWADTLGIYGEITIGANTYNVTWISTGYSTNTFVGLRLFDEGVISATVDNLKVTLS